VTTRGKRAFSKLAARTGYALYKLPVFQNLEWLELTGYWTGQERETWRLKRLSLIIDFAWTHVPFYRVFWGDHGVVRRPLRNLDDLQEYPILTKDVFRTNYRSLQPDNVGQIRHQSKHTGGTTGQPVHYQQDIEQWAFMQAFQLYGWSLAGYEFGDPVGVIAGGSLLPRAMTLQGIIRNFIERKCFLFGVHMEEKLAVDYHRKLTAHRTEFLYGYPSILFIFARFLADAGLRIPTLKAVITTGECLQDRYRAGIESALGCPVFNNLGCNDGGYESFECNRHQGLHYNDLQSILEVSPSAPAPSGELLITNLWNRSTPFVRYANGDLVTLGPASCPCGSSFPLIASVEGRTADILSFSNGRSLSGPALTLIFAPMNIDGWQIVKTAPDTLEVRVCTRDVLRPEYTTHITDVLRHHVGEGVTITIKRVDELAITAGGKRKPIWNDVPTEEAPREG
jgi:phenylacetate-CoA ligase